MICPKCGVQNEEDAIFCINCGVNIRSEKLKSAYAQQDTQNSYGQQPNMQNPNAQQQDVQQNPYEQNAYSQNPYGGQPYNQSPYGQQPYGQNPNNARPSYVPNVDLMGYSKGANIAVLIISIFFGGIVAIIFSALALSKGSKYEDAVHMGDFYRANEFAKDAKNDTIVAVVFIIIGIIVFILYLFYFLKERGLV